MSQFAEVSAKMVSKSWTAFTPVERVILVAGSMLCGFSFIWTGHLLGIPLEPGFSGSLLASTSPISAIAAVAIAMAISLGIASVFAAFIGKEAGLFCCCMGMAVLSIQCGAMRPVLQYASGPWIFVILAVETLLLGMSIFGVWVVLQKLFDRNTKSSEMKLAAPNEITDATLSQKLTVTGVQVIVTGALELILIQTDSKAQAMAGVATASFLGVLAAYMFMALPQGIWYWIGPTILGVIGFALNYFNNGMSSIGDLHGWSAGLARATPLDYAGMGTGAALLAYWCSRRWAQPEDAEADAAAA